MGKARAESRRPRRRLVAFAAGVFALAPNAFSQGSQHAIHMVGNPSPGADRVVIVVDDDDAASSDASTAADVGVSDFTVEFWLRGMLAANATQSGGGDREYFFQNWKQGNVIIDRDVAGPCGAEFGISIAGGFVRFGTGKGAAAPFDSEHTLEGDTNVLDGSWHHVACARQAGSGVKRIYVDGALDVESGEVSFADLSYPNAGANQGGHLPSLVVGADAYGSPVSNGPHFEGDLDELRLWSRALTASQILSRFDRVLPSPPLGLAAWYRFEEGTGNSAADSGPNAAPSALVVAATGSGVWTDYAANPQSCAPLSFGTLPPGFQRTVLTEALSQPTALEFLPDGRCLVAERGGAIRIVANGTLAPAPLVQLNVDNSNGERGLLGIARDPQFAANGYLYAFYTTVEPRDKVSRFTVSGASVVPNAELMIWQAPALASQYHHGGSLGFDASGKLLVGVGDQLNSANAQDLGSPFGKLLRLESDGTIPSDNPFVQLPGARPEVFASGFRNPFRFSVDSASGGLGIMVGDVGGNTLGAYEEADHVTSGGNYGWPQQEGENCYAGSCTAYTFPKWSYRHDDPDDYVLYPQGSITMGPVYRFAGPQAFPPPYQGNLFVADYANRSIRRLVLGSNGSVVAAPTFLWPGLGRTIVDLKSGPDGALYYLAYGVTYGGLPDNPGLLKIAYIGSGNAPPIALASATPLAGAPPLAVAFSSAGTSDPDNGPSGLAYSWSFGDGQFSTQQNPAHVYSSKGKFVAQLTVSDGALLATSDAIVIEVGGKPVPLIATPSPNLAYVAGSVVGFAGSASDPEDGVLAPAALTFEVLLVHEDHVHPFLGPLAGVASGSFTIPASGHAPAGTHFQIRLTATDSDGLTASTSVALHQNESTLAFATEPAGIPITLDGEPVVTPHLEPSMDGFQHAVAAPEVASLGSSVYVFRCWSDGGAAAHVVTAPIGGKNLTALYDAVVPSVATLTVSAADRNAQYQSSTGVLLQSAGDPNALCLGKDGAGFETAFEFTSPLPKGAAIVATTLDLTGTGVGFGQPACQIRAYDVADAAPFLAGSLLPLTQAAPMTSATVTWTVPQMLASQSVSSPDLAALLQEVVDRPDYAPGAHVGFVLDGAANTLSHFWCVQRFGTSNPPRLHVSYVVPGGAGNCSPPCGFTTIGPGIKAADALGLVGTGSPALGGVATILATGLKSATSTSLLVSLSSGSQPFMGGTLLVGLPGFLAVVPLPAIDGAASLPIPIATNPEYAGITLYFQAAAADPSQIAGVALSNGLQLTLCP